MSFIIGFIGPKQRELFALQSVLLFDLVYTLVSTCVHVYDANLTVSLIYHF